MIKFINISKCLVSPVMAYTLYKASFIPPCSQVRIFATALQWIFEFVCPVGKCNNNGLAVSFHQNVKSINPDHIVYEDYTMVPHTLFRLKLRPSANSFGYVIPQFVSLG